MIEPKLDDLSFLKSIKILTLGQFAIVLQNGAIYNTSSKANKLWGLFKLLLINHNKGITPEMILECLSPEVDYVDPSHTVQNMIYRLRKLLSSEAILENSNPILFANGCYKLNITEGNWLDFIELDKAVKEAEIIKKENPLQAIEYYRYAFDIYGGEFLPELYYEDWVVPPRTYYRSLYLKTIDNLSQLYAGQGLYASIIEVCQMGVAIEPFEEEIHVRLMENLINVGRIKEAKAHYEKTVSVFEKEFGIQPTPEMQNIAQMLRSDFVQVKTGRQNMPLSLLDEEDKGAVFCDYRDFYVMYVLEKRNCERSGNALCPVYIEFENGKNIFKSNAYRNSAIKEFKETLVNGLRKGDLVSLVDKTRFFILLHNAEYQIAQMVMTRVINQFHANNAFKDIILEIEVCPSLPKPHRK